MKTVSAAEANRNFSKLLRDVASGETVTITSHGRPVATVAPVEDEASVRERRTAALKDYIALLRDRPIQPIAKWSREELYEDEPSRDKVK